MAVALHEPMAAVLPGAAIAVVLPEPMAVLPEAAPPAAMAVVLPEAAVLPGEALPSAIPEAATAGAMGAMRAVFADPLLRSAAPRS